MLSGIATLEVDGETVILMPNHSLHVAAGVAHKLKNNDADDLIFLVPSTPPIHADQVEQPLP